MPIKAISVLVSLGMLIFSIDLVRREKLTFKYAAGWILISALALFFAVFDQLLFRIAYTAGFELPSNFIFFMLFVFFVFLSLFLTIFLCQQNSRNDCIAQKIGIMEFELERLQQLLEKKNGNGPKNEIKS